MKKSHFFLILSIVISTPQIMLCMKASLKMLGAPPQRKNQISELSQAFQALDLNGVATILPGKKWNNDDPSQLITYLVHIFEEAHNQKTDFDLKLVVAAIQKSGIDVKAVKDPQNGDTPMHMLFDGNEFDFKTERIGRAIYQILVILGLDVNVKNTAQMTPLECAIATDLDRKFPNFIASNGTIIDPDQKKLETKDVASNKADVTHQSSGYAQMLYLDKLWVVPEAVGNIASWAWSWAPSISIPSIPWKQKQ